MAPVLCCSILVLIRSQVTPKKHSARFYTPFAPSISPILTHLNFTVIHWSPKCDLLDEMFKKIIVDLRQEHGVQVTGVPFDSNTDMNAFFDINLLALAGISFDNDLINKTNFPGQVKVVIRFPGELRVLPTRKIQDISVYSWKTNILFPSYQTPGPRDFKNNEGPSPEYNKEGFLKLQMRIALDIINNLSNRTIPNIDIKLRRFPHPPWISDNLLSAFRLVVAMVIMISTEYICINNVRAVTTENEKQLKEAMRIMGLPNWLHWLAWFVNNFVLMLIAEVLVLILLKINWFKQGSVLPQSNPLVVFCFLCFFTAASTTFGFAISVFFSKANIAATVAGMVWFLSFFPYTFSKRYYDTMTLLEKLAICLFSTSAMGYGFQIILTYEGIGEGIQWRNIGLPTTVDDSLTLQLVIVMLTLDTILYMGIAIYVEAIFPGQSAVPKVWYFPFTRSYWFGPSEYEKDSMSTTIENEYFEKEPEHLPVGIRIINLRKVYSNKRVAVKNLNLNIYTSQITVLLGHNGAGKTTTMAMLTGIIRPTDGTAIIGGYDIRTNKKRARKSIGLCPQYNVLFDELTVAEHLYFFTKLKGMEKNQINTEINKYVRLLELGPKRNAQAGTLSGGMQRKLSVGIALCGNSKVVMLDEPTSGMDPAARRALWDLLISQKPGRAMLLSTHFMDEADLLGDRIAIMADGNLQCCGTSFFLKKKYGSGYDLIMEKSVDCVVSDVTALLQKYIPSLQVKSQVGNELRYVLADEYASVFENMLNDLENKSASLGIESYGISLTTLEEVFMKVGADNSDGRQYPRTPELTSDDRSDLAPLDGWKLWLNQFRAMLTKRVLSVYRTWPLYLVQNLIAVLFMSLALIIIHATKFYGDLPALPLNLGAYKDSVTVLTGNNTYSNRYFHYIRKNNHEIMYIPDGNMSDILYNEAVHNYVRVRQRYICGAEFSKESMVAWFNNEAYHSAPLCMQIVLNAVLKETSHVDNEMVFVNYPRKFTPITQLQDLSTGYSMGFQISFNLAFAMALVSPFYIIFYVKERSSKSKHLQFVSGVSVLAFWIPAFIVDLVTFTFTSMCVCFTMMCFDEEGFNTIDNLKIMFLALMCFAYAVLPLTYLAAFHFDVPSTAYAKLVLFFVLFGVATFFAFEMLKWPVISLITLYDRLHYAGLLVPHYNLGAFIRDTNVVDVTRSICNKIKAHCSSLAKMFLTEEQCLKFVCVAAVECCQTPKNYYDWKFPGVGRNIVYSVAEGTLFIIFLLLIEYKVIRKIRHRLRRRKYVPPDFKMVDIKIDPDVERENDFIRHASYKEITEYNLFMRDISKCYGKFVAVNNICLAVKKFECFGLLGLNGAGKTTTFKIMTGDIKCTSGDAWINGVPLKGRLKKIQHMIGYCPQFDALLDDLTCREMIIIFSLIRGLRVKDAKIKANKLAKEFDFTKHLDKQVYALSGGNKRKLSTSISVIGNPDVLYLDEPTTGMDPATKRFLWNKLCKIRDRGVCIVLTSHSMEECEALCTRIAIMVNGMFVCLGTPQHLKSKFSKGYTLIIKLKRGVPTDQVQSYIMQQIPSAKLQEIHQEMLTYYIRPTTGLKWSNLFGIIEKTKTKLNIEDYSIGQSSLEQPFQNEYFFPPNSETGRPVIIVQACRNSRNESLLFLEVLVLVTKTQKDHWHMHGARILIPKVCYESIGNPKIP
ncbi:hypothetical protein FQR65_LT03829 [Abscondita terminalis]|nr:hypothetical protein FQR65_LT03829 [Abscondita terminalis]